MKKSILCIALFLGMITSYAQGVNFGFKGGANFSTINTSFEERVRTGFHIGSVLELKFNDQFSVQPEILYSAQGAEIRNIKTNIDYLNVPILLKYKFFKPLSLEVGPQFGFVVQEGETSFITNDPKSLDVSGAIGVSAKFASFFVQARYNYGFTDAFENLDSKNSNFQISVGYYIF